MKSLRTVIGPLIAVCVLAGHLSAQTVPSTIPPATSGGELLPGDVVRVQVWREPDLSGDFTVNEQSSVVIPKLGAISVAGRSPAALKDSMLAGYATYLRNPSVEVTFLRRVMVMGAVQTPGLYTVDPTVTLPGVLALAGGVANHGKKDRVELVREGERMLLKLDERAPTADLRLRSGDQLHVPERSWLSRNPWILAAAISGTAGILRVALD